MDKLKQLCEFEGNLSFVNCAGFDWGDSISIVGSSGILSRRNDAKDIDSNDSVMRFNHAKTEGFENVCGKKTTIVLVNNHALELISNINLRKEFESKHPECKWDYIYDLKNLNIILRPDYPDRHRLTIKKVCENNNVAIITKKADHLARTLLDKMPSCGFSGLMIAIEYCEKINCYGFNFNQDPSVDKHYFEKGHQTVGGCHDFLKEQEIFKKLHDTERITLNY